MAATGKTPILLYGSTTATNTPSAGNLTNSSDGCEIAINVADKNLFFKDTTNTVNTVPIRQSGASSNGWLSSTDWNTFNNKQPAGTYVTSVTGTAPVVSSGGTTPAISMAAANGSTNGYLTSTDWNTFNNKQPAGSYALTTGNLSQFASTTSAQLAGVISDETGSGSLVFATSPTLVTPVLGNASATTITVANGNAVNTVTSYFTQGNSDAGFKLAAANGAGTTTNSEQAKIGLFYSTGTTPLAHIGFDRGSGANSRGITLNVNNTEYVRLDASGNLTANSGNFVVGTSGKGIDFSVTSQAAGMTSELLADYEEGTWTPALSFGGGTTGITYTSRSGYYTKVGNLVTVTGQILLSSRGSSTGYAAINGLPYTVNAAALGPNILDAQSAFSGLIAGGCLFVSPQTSNTFMYIFIQTTTGRTTIDQTYFGSSAAFAFQLTYFV